ncbi:MAG: hypothetical protein ACKN89_17065 [Cyanobium sp.]
MSIDKNERQRGSDEPDTPLLLQGDGDAGEGDVVIGGKQSNQGDHGAAEGLQQTLAIQAQPRTARDGG